MEKQDSLIFKTKNFLKGYPRFFLFWYYLVAFFVGKKPDMLIRSLPKGAIAINVGSGIESIPGTISIDFEKYDNVDIIADAANLPYGDNSIDLIIAKNLLEHVADVDIVVNEFYRVLKPGGFVYLVTPFMLGFHSAPGDYFRWTTSGLRKLMARFEEKEIGVAVGPSSALAAMLREWCSMVLSLGSTKLYQFWILVFMIIFIPLNIFDFLLVKFHFSENAAMAYYYIGVKQ